jgi:hypothetical protein
MTGWSLPGNKSRHCGQECFLVANDAGIVGRVISVQVSLLNVKILPPLRIEPWNRQIRIENSGRGSFEPPVFRARACQSFEFVFPGK